MAAVHFITIPFEPNTVYILFWGAKFVPVIATLPYPKFEAYKTFLCVFMSNFIVFMR